MTSFFVADAHVDVLWRMDKEGQCFYGPKSNLQASYERLRSGGVRTQVFALYVSTDQPGPSQLEAVLRSIHTFHEQLVKPGAIRLIRTRQDLALAREHGEIAALLSLEGLGCLSGNPELIWIFHELGVRGAGLTWNPVNEFADGCMEPRGAGLTQAGKQLVQIMHRLGMWVDVAHLADRGVYDVLELHNGPVMASHANVRSVHHHPRNLPDAVIRELISRGGWIGLTFEGSFVAATKPATVDDIFRHLDYILELGGDQCVGFGSDFDGTSNPVYGLQDASDYRRFGELILKRYGEELGQRILFRNFERFLMRHLPA
jgi:membrane dipeptidase